MLEFVNPRWFWLLLVLLPYLLFELLYKPRHRATFFHPKVEVLKKLNKFSNWTQYITIGLNCLIIILFVVALARPRLAHKRQEIKGKGIDIVMAIDISGSMKAIDFQPENRLGAAKEGAEKFIENRKNDRIGLVTFAETAFTQCPLTLDYNVLMTILDNIEIDETANGTAIGLGLATAVGRLKDSEAKTKVIILITDGRRNRGEIEPSTAADLAKTYGIKVYTIGVGKEGEVDFPVQTGYGVTYRKMRVDIDMETLNSIAQITGTERARRATNTKELFAIMDYIDKLEKTELKIKNYYEYEELFYIYLILGLILLLIQFVYRFIFVKEIP